MACRCFYSRFYLKIMTRLFSLFFNTVQWFQIVAFLLQSAMEWIWKISEKTASFVPRLLKEKYFKRGFVITEKNPTFSTFKNKTTWVLHATVPSGEKNCFLYMQLCQESPLFSTSQEYNKGQPPLRTAYTSPNSQTQHTDKTNISNRLE